MENVQKSGRMPLEGALEAVRETLRRALRDTQPPMLDLTAHLAESEGKNFRALLLLATASDGEVTIPTDAVTAAAAIELLHLATLVHDDVIDDAEERRGMPSIKSRFGNKAAVVCGDYLFCKCFMMVAQLAKRFQDQFEIVARAMTKICLGELRQLRHNADAGLTVRQYLKIIAGKTSALFALSMYTGALLAGEEPMRMRRLARAGHYIGMAFQLTDDCLDYETKGYILKKPVKNDLAEGVVTLPLILAMADKPELRDVVGKNLAPREAAEIAAQVIALGGVQRTKNVAGRYCDKAARLIEQETEGPRRDALLRLLEKIRVRVY
ncbi:MAG TPA: polyprenyl synthetase family protein [Papillibacter sp.]|jgi:heptaprenyl diphosphate synthase|nr:polyprenyl synthetase family protein [Papillibacter sp.]